MQINCKGKLIDLSIPKVMGIFNVTPDSFFDGGKYPDDRSILNQIELMLKDGADFIDLGGFSSRPGAEFISEETEKSRIVPAVELIIKQFPDIILSVDTFRSHVAKSSVESGAAIINDISAGSLDSEMLATMAKLQVPYIMMHMRGMPQTMQQQTNYDDLIQEMLYYFSEKIALARSLGINDLILDPGFGFAKTTEQNFEVLRNLKIFRITGLPILTGISRKSMICKTLECEPSQALNGTTSLNMAALINGTSILRVHDVKEAVECVKLFNAIYPKSIDDDTARYEGL